VFLFRLYGWVFAVVHLVEELRDKPKISGLFRDGIVGIFIDLNISAVLWL